MKFLKWLLTIVASLTGLVALGGAYAAIWISDDDLVDRVAGTAYMSFILAVLTGFAACFLWSEE